MGESTKVICAVVLIISSVAGAMAWLVDRPDALVWSLRIGGPSLAALAIGLLLRLRLRADIAHDYLRELAGGHDYYNCDGFSFVVSTVVVEKTVYFGIYYQNQRDQECQGRIAFRPEGGHSPGHAAVENIAYEIDCPPAAFGVARIAVPVPEKQPVTCQSSRISVAVKYPKGRGRRLRFGDGVSPTGVTFEIPVGAIDAVLDKELKTLWKLGDPPLVFPLVERLDRARARLVH
jgi:hypothetical protein